MVLPFHRKRPPDGRHHPNTSYRQDHRHSPASRQQRETRRQREVAHGLRDRCGGSGDGEEGRAETEGEEDGRIDQRWLKQPFWWSARLDVLSEALSRQALRFGYGFMAGETQDLAVEKPFGRPTKYQPEYVEQAYKLCLLGATDPEIADFFGTCVKTLYNWRDEYPDFLQAIHDGKLKADAEVAYKLHGRATGFEWEEEQIVKLKTGQFSEKYEIVKINKVVPPDTSAAIMWLTNRQKGLWRNTQSLQNLDKNGDPTDAPQRVQIEIVGTPPAQLSAEPRQARVERRPIVEIDVVR